MRADSTFYSFSDGLSWPVLVWHVTPWLTNTFWFHFYSVFETASLVALVQLPLRIVWDLASNFRNWSKCSVCVWNTVYLLW